MKSIFAIVNFVVLLLLATSCSKRSAVGNTISAEEVFAITNDSVGIGDFLIIDTRNRMDYVRGHLVSAIWINVDSLDKQLGMLPKDKRTIIVYDSAGTNTKRISQLFTEHSLGNFRYLYGGFSKWTSLYYPAAIQLVRNTDEVINISPGYFSAEQVHDITTHDNTDFVIIDVRPYPAFNEAHIKSAISIPYIPINEFVVKMEERNFARAKPIVVYCDAQTCSTSEKAAEVLLRNDYTNVYILEDGIDGWLKKNYPIE